MINVDFVNISNSRMIGRLLPYWARGRNIQLFIQAILSPIILIHNAFKAWALERYIECHITAQRASLEWYLNYRLRSHFYDPNASFCVTHGIDESVACFTEGLWYNELHWINDLRWELEHEENFNTDVNFSCFNTGRWESGMFWNNSLQWSNEENGIRQNEGYIEAINQTNVYAPEIVDTVSYNHEDYERDIRNIMSKFMINFNKLKIIITNPIYEE